MFKRVMIGVAVAALVAGCQPKTDGEAEPLKLDTDQQKLSYGMGYNLGSRIKGELDLNVEAFAEGVRHGTGDGERLMTDEEIVAAMEKFQKTQQAKQEAEFEALAEKNKAESEQYLAGNANKEGVETTESGLQYRVIEAGDGAKPALTDMVQVHYRGTLVDGTEFDSSYARGEPVTFPVNGVIPGWTEALQLMHEGAKWELVIPAELAYGPGGTGGPIGPNQALLFEVELLKVNPDSAGGAGEE